MRPPAPVLAAASVLALGGCAKQLEAPAEPGVCWHLASAPGAQPRFNRLADHQSDLEHCAGQLEAMRLRFRALGSTPSEVVGAYQGQFLFLEPEGVFTAATFKGYRYPLMVRTGDGRLAVPGAMPQPPQ
ncbi:MAG: hypothetical protein JOZ27_00060 [Caulobacteraceae bacterium]|nr:hypothetical protein [Caulobacteraceae bacterium]